jgi:hypothetical protein
MSKQRRFMPVAEIKTAIDADGKVVVEHHKSFQAVHFQNLAQDIMDRSAEADTGKGVDEFSDLVAVVILLVTSLECFLNDELISHAHIHYGKEYRAIAESLLGGTLRSRVLRVVPVTSKSRKRLSQGHHEIALLFELISLRNSIVHAADYFVDGDKTDPPLPKTITLERCTEYANALDEFFAAVLSGTHVVSGQTPWDNKLIEDARSSS